MEALIIVALGILGFFIYFTLTITVHEKFTQSKGIYKFF